MFFAAYLDWPCQRDNTQHVNVIYVHAAVHILYTLAYMISVLTHQKRCLLFALDKIQAKSQKLDSLLKK